jgi:hypothetical protein
MAGPDSPTPEQLAALDQLIAALERGDTNPAEIAQTLKAAPPPQQQQLATWQRVVNTIGATNVGWTVIATVAVARSANADAVPSVADLPDEVTLEQLLAVRQSLSKGS